LSLCCAGVLFNLIRVELHKHWRLVLTCGPLVEAHAALGSEGGWVEVLLELACLPWHLECHWLDDLTIVPQSSVELICHEVDIPLGQEVPALGVFFTLVGVDELHAGSAVVPSCLVEEEHLGLRMTLVQDEGCLRVVIVVKVALLIVVVELLQGEGLGEITRVPDGVLALHVGRPALSKDLLGVSDPGKSLALASLVAGGNHS
jgi:hypothetical protein